MTSLEQYVKQNIQFANSIVIKSIDVALAVNKGLLKSYYKIPENKKEWKYFLNIAGEKHASNSDVQITVIEMGQKQSLTKDLLERYQYTRKELLANGTYYEELIFDYPNDIAYIHGCMYPCDIDKAINAEDGTILGYNNLYLEEQEYQLINDLEIYIKNFMKRWNVSEYSLVDELFIPGMLATLYASLPSKIMNLRLDNVLTNQAHSFHLEHFFRTHMDIWDEVAILQKSTIYWLYKNLTFMIRNIGKEQTFQTIIEKILNPNLIGLGEYILRVPNVELVNNPDKLDPVYRTATIVGSSAKLNNYYSTDGEQIVDIATLVNREIQSLEDMSIVETTVSKNSERNEAIIAQVKRDIAKTYTDRQKTKLLEITTYQLFKRNGIDLFKFIIDYLIYTYKNKTLTYLEEYIEPNNNRSYLCDPKAAILMLIKLIMKMTNSEDVKISKLYYDTVLFPDKTCIDEAKKSLFPDGYIDRLLPELKNNYPAINRNCYSALEFKDLMIEIASYYNYLWSLDANTESGYVSANLKMLCNLITDKGYIELTDKPDGDTIDNILADNNIDYTVQDNFDFELSYKAMMLAFTGLTIDEYEEIRETSTGFKSLVEKLTSYTIQTFMADTGEDTLFVRYNNTGVMRAYTGIVTLNSGRFIPLEKNKFVINAEATIFKDNPITIPGSNINISASMSKENKINLNGYIDQDVDTYWIAPNIQAEIYDYNPYPLTRK